MPAFAIQLFLPVISLFSSVVEELVLVVQLVVLVVPFGMRRSHNSSLEPPHKEQPFPAQGRKCEFARHGTRTHANSLCPVPLGSHQEQPYPVQDGKCGFVRPGTRTLANSLNHLPLGTHRVASKRKPSHWLWTPLPRLTSCPSSFDSSPFFSLCCHLLELRASHVLKLLVQLPVNISVVISR